MTRVRGRTVIAQGHTASQGTGRRVSSPPCCQVGQQEGDQQGRVWLPLVLAHLPCRGWTWPDRLWRRLWPRKEK